MTINTNATDWERVAAINDITTAGRSINYKNVAANAAYILKKACLCGVHN
jgi:hypothetical protein